MTDHPTPPPYGPGSPYADMQARLEALEEAAEGAAPGPEYDGYIEKADAIVEEMRAYRRTYRQPPVTGFVMTLRLINVPEDAAEIVGATVPITADALLSAVRANLPANRWEASYEVTYT